MDLLLSTQENGGIKVINLNRFEENIQLSFKHEFSVNNHYINKFLIGNFNNKTYLVIARVNGLIQLYEKCKYDEDDIYDDYDYDTYSQDLSRDRYGSYDGDSEADTRDGPSLLQDKSNLKTRYQLFKEWKNSNIGENDEIISIGFIDNRYLYSCSIQGKLIIRDLINDDANQSYKVYFIANPISAIEISLIKNDFIIAVAGFNNNLKVYNINSQNDVQSFSFANLLKSSSLTPSWATRDENFIVLIKFVKNLIFCGTQFGKLLVYNKNTQEQLFSTKLSQFQITLFKFEHYIIFCDSVSKIGIMDSDNFKIVLLYSNLKLGPVSSIQFFWNSVNDPIYLITTTLDKHFRIFKLENKVGELIIELPKMNSTIPSFCILNNYQYHLFDKLFGNGSFKHPPKRKMSLPTPVKKKKIVIDHKDEDRRGEDRMNEDLVRVSDNMKN